jgi:hypothetical protein
MANLKPRARRPSWMAPMISVCRACDTPRHPAGSCRACGHASRPPYATADAVLLSLVPDMHRGTIVGESEDQVRRAEARRAAAMESN